MVRLFGQFDSCQRVSCEFAGIHCCDRQPSCQFIPVCTFVQYLLCDNYSNEPGFHRVIEKRAVIRAKGPIPM